MRADQHKPVRPELVEGCPFCCCCVMPFWTYMLQCRDRTLYVGHTDDLDVRLAQHEQGTFGGYTARKRPVTLVWCEEFPTRDEALAAERQIKGWRKEKKLALIRNDWGHISRLSRQKKERPSTGSGRTARECSGEGPLSTVRPELVKDRHFSLLQHPSRPKAPGTMRATIRRSQDELFLTYETTSDLTAILLPSRSAPVRTLGLWQHTCFEAFLRHPDGGYWEFNFAPSGAWAAFAFSGYREGMRDLGLEPPQIMSAALGNRLELSVKLRLPPGTPATLHVNLSAVIEETNGCKSYWALAHPPGKPDFHHPACFALQLPPAESP